MKAVVQRVENASVSVGSRVTGSIERGLLVYLGVSDSDTTLLCRKMVEKISKLRVFGDSAGKMNLNLRDAGAAVLVVSQFTLYADLKKGNRPSFDNAGRPEHAKEIYEQFIGFFSDSGIKTEHGEFGADMKVTYSNIGPATFILDSDELFG